MNKNLLILFVQINIEGKLFIASYYKQSSTDSKITIIGLIPSLLSIFKCSWFKDVWLQGLRLHSRIDNQIIVYSNVLQTYKRNFRGE